jgi:hypothetical protein
VTAATAVRCACCQTQRPAAEVYERVPRSGEFFCKDTAGCRRRIASLGDPVGEIAAEPPPAVAGAACSICAAAEPPGGVYERSGGVFACLDRPGCQERSVETQYLTAWSDGGADRMISPADMRAMAAAAPPQVPPERTELDPEEMARMAAQEALGRKRNAGQPSPDEMVARAARTALGQR